MAKKLILLAGLLCSSTLMLSAQSISVTDIDKKGDMVSVLINGVIEINEIELQDGKLVLPAYIPDSGERQPVVRFRTKEAYDVVEEAVRTNRPSREPSKRINYQITKLSPFDREGSSLKAFAEVTFNGVLDVDVKVMESQRDKDLWISWPARAPDKTIGERSWVDQVKLINRRVKDIVETDLKESYQEILKAGPSVPDVKVNVREGVIDTPLTVTNVEVEKKSAGADLLAVASVDLNYAVRINDIRVYERRGQTFLEFPVSVSDTGREYDQMRIFSRPLRNEIRNAIDTGQPSQEKYAEVGFEISKFDKFDRESSLKYFCAVTLNQALEIECVIIDGAKYDAFVSWPSEKVDGGYNDQIIPINRNLREAMEAALLKKYRQQP
ncbi:MAG: hypothetical protein GX817_04060 [Elusimicrobia bacterium]|nr:hypothetical protein [Elusimicrobiota bacterium]